MKSAAELMKGEPQEPPSAEQNRIDVMRHRKATGVANLILGKVITQAEIVLDGLSDTEWYGLCVEAGFPNREEKPPSAESREIVKQLVRGAKIA